MYYTCFFHKSQVEKKGERMEQIYTIPVNEAFDRAASEESCGCPFCALYNHLEENELDLILGASMMEPDVRQKTNEQGFCHRHFGNMFHRKNRLGLGLILESHLDKVHRDLSGDGLLSLLSGTGTAPIKKLGRLEESCYVCGRIEMHFSRMYDTVLLLYGQEGEFRRKFAAQPYFCLPHYRRLIALAKETMNKKAFADFYAVASAIEEKYISSLSEDVSWFCKKFDYRYADEPWYNAKDSVERSIRFLTGDMGSTPTGGEKK